MPANHSISPRLILATGTILLLTLAGSATWLIDQQRAAYGWVRHTAHVEQTLADLRISSMRAELARRAYIITGRATDRKTYTVAVSELPRKIRLLKALTIDNAAEGRRIDGLVHAFRVRRKTYDKTIAMRASDQIQQVSAIFDSKASRAETADIVLYLDAIRSEEASLQTIREARADRLQTLAQAALLASAALVALLAFFVALDRRQRLKALRASNEQLNLLATNVTDAVFRTTLEGVCLYASPSVREVTGYDPEALVGHSVLQRLHPDDANELRSGFAKLAAGSMDLVTVVYRSRYAGVKDGWIWLEAQSRLVRDQDGRPKEVVASIRDITKRKSLEIDLDCARVRAEEAVKSKSLFLANMSHEIRTPMNGVIGFTDLLLHSSLTDEQRRQTDLIAESGRAMMRLLNDILDLSKVEAGQMTVAKEPFNLPHTLRACLKLIAPAASKKCLDLQFDLDPDLPVSIIGDGLRLRQVLLNLLGNAAKFTSEGSIALRARAEGELDTRSLIIEVQDTGIGIEPDAQAAVFEQFVQANQNIAPRFGGTGLGLAISAQLTRLMGGTLRLASEPEHGTCFTLAIPLVAAPSVQRVDRRVAEDAPRAPSAAGSIADAKRLRVLVAEDHDINQMLIMGMLAQLGCDADLATDGDEVLSMVARANRAGAAYDIILMDMQMPRMDGMSATREVRAANIPAADLPIVALTANAFADDIAACLDAGMQAHLTKPISLAELQAALRRWSRYDDTQHDRRASSGARVDAKYRARKAAILDEADALLRSQNISDEAWSQMSGLLHKLAGTAGMFGDAELGACAALLVKASSAWSKDDRDIQARIGLSKLKEAA